MEKPPDLRTCATCACHHAIQPPRIAAAGRGPAPPGARPHHVCRLNPPYAVQFPSPDGTQMLTGLAQAPTTEDTTCWQWRPLSALPGENAQFVEMLPALARLAEKAGVAFE